MANISDLSGDEREQRIAELKKKMQQAAKKTQAEHAADETGAVADTAPPSAQAPAAVAESADVVAAEAEDSPVATASEGASASEASGESAPVEEAAQIQPATNGAAANGNGYNGPGFAPATTASVFKPVEAMSEEELEGRQMNRREFLTYAFGGAMGLVALQAGVVSFFFMYPRFKAGEFGGLFFMGPESSAPPVDASPIAVADGKFWWVNVEGEGPKAIYMVCTHLGCLYKWVGENNRFECPCHGSKFTREGDYIEGPAPRSLDHFELAVEDGEFVVDTGARVNGAPASESPAAGTG
jgi:cytochrome b6-f complex iron-sulfur subunit